MKVLVTGCAGFLGYHVCGKLLARGDEVVGLDVLDSFYDPALKLINAADLRRMGEGFHFMQGDVLDEELTTSCLSDCDGVIHLAGLPGVRASAGREAEVERTNVRGTMAVHTAMARTGVRAMVLASSSSVYGGCPLPFDEGMACAPLSPYGKSKQAAELLCTAYAHAWGAGMVCARMFSVYGPRQRPDLAMRRFASRIMRGERLELYGDCKRDYTEVSDIARGLLLALDWTLENQGCEAVNLGAGRAVSTLELVRSLERALGRKARTVPKPPHPLDLPETLADTKKARTLLGWRAEIPLERGVERFCAWMNGEED